MLTTFCTFVKPKLFYNMKDFKRYENKVYRIIGAAMKVHTILKNGLLEPLYQEALCIELHENGIDNEREKEIKCYYKNHLLDKTYKVDILVEDIILELKSVKELLPEHRAQLFNYMRLTKSPIGVLINFGNQSLQGERYGFIEEINECVLLDKHMNIIGFEQF